MCGVGFRVAIMAKNMEPVIGGSICLIVTGF